ncbi:D-alanyl-D-alanine carboxypeptidase [Streptomyces sp. JA03]|nr:D-alanyl-D-alanine carboxypeptidase [Streptomyces barringtoniae]
MITGLSHRVAVSACSLCVAGVLALTPAAASAGPRSGEPGPPGPGAAMPGPNQLYRSGSLVRPHPDAPALPEVSALSWVVADAGSGAVLAASDAHRKLPPASTLKTLFALTVLPALPAGMRHTVRNAELADIGQGSSLVGVKEGLTYRVSDLWRGVFLNSGNDAVHVLASMNGGWEATAAQMQVKARSLGAMDTHVVSPDGYDADGQVSSAYDLAVFGREGLRNPDFARYCSTAEAYFPGEGSTYGIRNTNRLLTGQNGVGKYPGLIGIKNGYTSKAGNTLVAAARHGSRTLVVTVMNPQKGGGLAVYQEARELLDWGFAAAGRVDPVGSLDGLRVKSRPVSPAKPVAAATSQAPADRSGWPGPAVVAGLAGLVAGAAVVALRAAVVVVLRARGKRSPRG